MVLYWQKWIFLVLLTSFFGLIGCDSNFSRAGGNDWWVVSESVRLYAYMWDVILRAHSDPPGSRKRGPLQRWKEWRALIVSHVSSRINGESATTEKVVRLVSHVPIGTFLELNLHRNILSFQRGRPSRSNHTLLIRPRQLKSLLRVPKRRTSSRFIDPIPQAIPPSTRESKTESEA